MPSDGTRSSTSSCPGRHSKVLGMAQREQEEARPLQRCVLVTATAGYKVVLRTSAKLRFDLILPIKQASNYTFVTRVVKQSL